MSTLLTISVSSAGEAYAGFPHPSAGRDHGSVFGPKQREGTAAGRKHVQTGPANKVVPPSLRSRYPLKSLPAAARGRNTARVEYPAARATGFVAGRSTELPALRTQFHTVYANPDGTQTTVYSQTPSNYRDATGRWTPVRPALRPSTGGSLQSGGGAAHVDLTATGTARAVDYRLADDASIGWTLAGARRVSPVAHGASAHYGSVQSGVDLVVTPQPAGVKETIVLHSAKTPSSWAFPLTTSGLTARIAGRTVQLVDAHGTVRAVVPAGSMSDSAPKPATSNAVRYRLTGAAGHQSLHVDVDRAWLRDKARVYPVSIDPTVAAPSATTAVTVQSNGTIGGDQEVQVGLKGGVKSAAYLGFPGVSSDLRYETIYGAQLSVVNFDSASCKARPVGVYPVTQSWSAGDTSLRYPGPSVGRVLASQSYAKGYVGLGEKASKCPVDAASLYDLGVAGRNLVQGWVNGSPNNGLSLRASDSDTAAWKKFAGPGTVNGPKLYITHSKYNATYRIANPVPNPSVLQNQDGAVKVTVTNRGSETWTPSSYYLAYRAFDGNGKPIAQQRSASLPGNLARGASVTLTASIKHMPAGSYVLDFTMVHTGGPIFTDEQVPPARLILQVYNIPPVLTNIYPANGYQSPTLTPELWAQAIDKDAPASGLTYNFDVCPQGGTCFSSGYLAQPAWTVPAGKLTWNGTYTWRTHVKDKNGAVTDSPDLTFLTAVPQPAITGHLANSQFSNDDQDFDPLVGNYSTAAIDAPITTVGPALSAARTYNSLDPRTSGAFGAGWSTLYDSNLVQEDDGSGNVLVTLPDGQLVRFGKNPDGTYVPPSSQDVVLTFSSSTNLWTLRDSGNQTYTYSSAGRLSQVKGPWGKPLTLAYDTSSGKLTKVTSGDSGRYLTFAWTGAHVTSVSTNPVDGSVLTWTYTYSGDQLAKVCAPGNTCTSYDQTSGSHYRSAVMDARPESYWRLGEPDGTAAGSEVGVNLGADSASLTDVTLGTAGAVAGTSDTAATFNGTSSVMTLPSGTAKKSRDMAVELWFKTASTQTNPLLGYQDKALSATPTTGVPMLYVGTDGKLRGQFWTGAIAPITTAGTVNNNQWHHVVLSVMGSAEKLYLDGALAGSATANVNHSMLTYAQVGAAYASSASWPGYGAARRTNFNGAIDEVAVYSHPLSSSDVTAHRSLGVQASAELSQITLPSGRIGASVTYDTVSDRVKEYTDEHNGTWKLTVPAYTGSATDLRKTILVRDPSDRPSLYEYDGIGGWLLRTGTPQATGVRSDDKPPAATSPPTSPVCTTHDSGDPSFCTYDASGGTAGGTPTFTTWDADGMSIRSYSYDANGQLQTVTNEVGATISMTYDDHGNVTSRTTCRAAGECYTTRYTFPTGLTDPLDPRWDKATETRDGRSASATDNTYRTTSTYTAQGDLASQTAPDGGVTRTTFSTGAEVAVGGGYVVSGLPVSTTDPRGAVTRYGYYSTSDLAQITEPSGAVTKFTYDELGRKTSQTEVSDTFPSGTTTTYTYDSLSRIVSTTEPTTTDVITGVKHQRRSSYTYDADGLVLTATVADALGNDSTRTTTTSYDEQGNPQTVTDPSGGETTYTYDDFGNKTSMVDAAGDRTLYLYTARNDLAEVRLVDPDGDGGSDYQVLSSAAFDPAGRQVQQTDAMGRTVTIEYYGDDLVKSKYLADFHNADGTTRKYVLEADTYDGAGNLTKQVSANGTRTTTYTHDAVGRAKTTVVDPNKVAATTSYNFDLAGNVTRVSVSGNPSGASGVFGQQTRVTDLTYDTAGRQTKSSTALDNGVAAVSTQTYDQLGNVVASTAPLGNVDGADASKYTNNYVYDELGRQVQTISPPTAIEQAGQDTTTQRPTASVGYDTFDEQVGSKDANGNVSSSTFDARGNETSDTSPSYVSPATADTLTPKTTSTYDSVGNVTSQTDGRGNTTKFTYDRLGRVRTVDEPLDSDAKRGVTSYTYTATGEVASTVDPTGARSESTYDDLDREVTATTFERVPQNAAYTSTVVYDDAGNAVKATTPAGNSTTSVYDGVDQLTSVTDPNGVTVRYGYNGFGDKIQSIDALNRTSQWTYDLGGRMTGESDIDAAGTSQRAQHYDYDVEGNLVSATPATGHPTTYAYDNLDQLSSQVQPVSDGKSITTSYGYDAAGSLTRYTDGRGNKTQYTVNSWGLPESTIKPATAAHPSAADRTWTLSYDANGQATTLAEPGGVQRTSTFDAAGRVTSTAGTGATSPTPTKKFGYDADDRLTSASTPGGDDTYSYDDRDDMVAAAGPSGDTAMSYDADGQLTKRTDAAGTASFSYANGRLSAGTDPITGLQQTYGYDPSGAVNKIDYGAGRAQKFTYDGFGRLSAQTLVNSAGSTVASASYGYDLDNNITSKTTTGVTGAGTNSYTYDWLDRLTSWDNGSKVTDYAYDASSNRIKAGNVTATFDERNELLTSGSTSYTYTARGTLDTKTTGATTTPFSFDAFDRLTSDGVSSMSYDSLDRVFASGTSTMKYDANSTDLVSDGKQTFGRDVAGNPTSLASGGTKRSLLTDQHGDVIGGFDPADTTLDKLADSKTYDPWGQPVASSGSSYDLGFQGAWTAPTSGQVNMNARWYDPSTGTFDSQDSVDEPTEGSALANQYLYGAANPVTQADPDGNWPCFSCAWHKVTHAVKRAVHHVAHAVSTAYHYVAHAVTSTASFLWDYAKKAASFTWNVVKTVASGISKAAKAVYHKAKSAVSYVYHKAADAVDWAAQRAQQAAHWAAEKARQAAVAAHKAAVAVTKKVKAAIVYAVKHSPIPAIVAATKAVYSGIKTVVSAVAKLPAAVVSATVNVVKGIRTAVEATYHAAVKAAGTVVHAVSTAVSATADFAASHWKTIVTVAAGLAVGLGCTLASGGTATAACVIAGTAVVGALGSALNCPAGRSVAGCAARGAVAGAVGGAVMVATGGLGSGVAVGALAGGTSSVAQTATQEYLDTGSVDTTSLLVAAGTGAGGGALAGAAGKAKLGRGDAEAVGCNSFAGSTAVRMADGTTKPIDQIHVGDKVLAVDTATGKTVVETVSKVWLNHDTDLLDLTVRVGGTTGVLHATQNHPFWLPATHAWVFAKNLRRGDALRTDSGAVATVVGSRVQPGAAPRWDLTVANVHDFYVVAAGATAVLVHNCVVPGHEDGGVVLRLKYKEGWSDSQIAEADTKVDYLNSAAEGTGLHKTLPQRLKLSARSRLQSAGEKVPPGADADHRIDLQLGGLDDVSNLGPLDSSVNRSLGSQINGQLKNLPHGTCIVGIKICH